MILSEALTRVALFRALSAEVLDHLIERGATLKLPPGGHLVTQGAADSGFQLVVKGGAIVSVNGVERATLAPGDYFGEISLIDHAPRSATVVAGPEGVETFALSSLTFAALMDDHPEVARALLPVLTARVRAAEASPGHDH